MNRAAPRIAIIGAGWAGLSCALELTAAGAQVNLFEAGRQPGGRARGLQHGNVRLDNGQHLLLGAYSATLRQLQRLGALPQLQRQPLQMHGPQGFRLALPGTLPAPLHLAWGLLRAQGLSLNDKLAAVRFMQKLKRQHYRLKQDATVSQLLAQEAQPERLSARLWRPLCLAALNTPPAQASAQLFINVLRDSLGGPRAATDLLLPQGDLGQLFAEPAVRWLTAHGAHWRPGQRIRQLTPSIDGWRVDDDSAPYQQIVIATAPQHAAALLAPHPACAPALAAIAALTYAPITTVYLHYATAPLAEPLTMLAGPTGQDDECWLIKRDDPSQPGCWLGAVFSASDGWPAADDNALAAAIHQRLQQQLGRTLVAPLAHFLTRERRATFLATPDLARPAHAQPLPGLWLAGDYTAGDYPATLEGAVRSGVGAAQKILAVGIGVASGQR